LVLIETPLGALSLIAKRHRLKPWAEQSYILAPNVEDHDGAV